MPTSQSVYKVIIISEFHFLDAENEAQYFVHHLECFLSFAHHWVIFILEFSFCQAFNLLVFVITVD